MVNNITIKSLNSDGQQHYNKESLNSDGQQHYNKESLNSDGTIKKVWTVMVNNITIKKV